MRNQGWEKDLDNYIVEQTSKYFKWGQADCLIFASDWCVICCNVDPMKAKKKNDPKTIRGLYSTEEEAKKLIKSLRKSTPDIMDVHFDRVLPNFLQRGDIAFYKMAFGIVIGRGYAMFNNEEKGLIKVKLEDCKIGWRVEKR